MKRSSLALLVPTALVLALGFAPAAGAQATAKVTCKDGTTSTATGRGACSAHGGVAPAKAAMKVAAKADKAADKAAAKTEKAADKSAAKADKSADKSAAKAGKSADKAAAKTEKAAAKGAKGSEKAAEKTEKAAEKTEAKSTVAAGASAEVTAKCKDGTMSKSKSRRGACSGHGGVASWTK